jgi:CRP-like cAMP-binding protein
MSEQALEQIEEHIRLIRFSPGQLVIRAGEDPDAFYLIVRGRAGVAGKRLSRTLREGDHFGEIALVDGGPRSATVIALDELYAIEIPGHVFLDLLAQDAEFTRKIMASLAKRVRTLEHAAGARSAPAAVDGWAWPIPGLA